MLLYNNVFLPIQDLKLSWTNRAFQYNDGFFETILVVEGRLRFWSEHQARITEAAEALQLAIPGYFQDGELEENLLQLAKQRQVLQYGRIKLKVWRAGGGLYIPQSNEIEWLATAEVAPPIPDSGIRIGICQSVRTLFSPLSHFKGPQAPLYVLAGIEKQKSGLDDMLLVDVHGNVSELISSNIFWLKDGVLYTPALETGCVNGILRRNILRWCQQQGIAALEVLAKPEEIVQANCVFAANVTGIRGIEMLADHQLHIKNDWLQAIKAGLQV
ncbi:aminotransferase class IV [Pontibacter indicus]|uniref:branched-chain-amino-acid transaminase n=1 Tax=Pontibacter indicus TaxID=1317125 RepID=A0A1R3WQM9_9BACT|nr:aminotransferase class IV [Pontibacter indicus]SIT80137.1 branched-chain amino acid aminotransferase/4-amino-4-deoxychorismate lyase [Pontibacter indicus]